MRRAEGRVDRVDILSRHFFRRFFDNDTITTEGETETTVVRALCAVAVPPLMAAFWQYSKYAHFCALFALSHGPGGSDCAVTLQDVWVLASDRYFFVLYPFIVMGLAGVVEWEMLFPDRSDFQILLPLGLREWEMFWAKGKALLKFLGMFLVAANLAATLLYAAESTPALGPVWRNMGLHAVAVTASGVFAAFAMLALGGLTVMLVPPRWFRRVSALVQMCAVTVLIGMVLPFPFFSDHMQMLLSSSEGLGQWLPPVWFLGLYEELRSGSGAPAGVAALGRIALWALLIAVVAAVMVYPLAWARQRKRAMEGDGKAAGRGSGSLLRPLFDRMLKMPQQRAVFYFISQTITRSQRYQLYLAFYAGVGLALAICCSLTLRADHGVLALGISAPGIRAALPLLLFWMAMGLRTAFAFPVDMRARWVFPVNLKTGDESETTRTARAGQLWLLLAQLALIAVFPLVLAWAGLWWWPIVLETAYGVMTALLLVAALFVGRTQIPFTTPRLPGRQALPVVMVTYAAIFPALVLTVMQFEMMAEGNVLVLARAGMVVIGALLVIWALDQLARKGIIGGFPEDEEEEGPLRLGLSR